MVANLVPDALTGSDTSEITDDEGLTTTDYTYQDGSVNLSWQAPEEGDDITGYRIERRNSGRPAARARRWCPTPAAPTPPSTVKRWRDGKMVWPWAAANRQCARAQSDASTAPASGPDSLPHSKPPLPRRRKDWTSVSQPDLP